MSLRPLATLALIALASIPASAQGVVGGTVVEERTRRPLACWVVELRTSPDSVLARTYTRRDGTFEFPSPDSGSYSFRFGAFGLQPGEVPFESSGPAMHLERKFVAELTLIAVTDSGAPRQVSNGVFPRYPDGLRSRGIEGGVRAAYLIDSIGRIDSASAFIWDATHKELEESVRRALPGMRFTFAERPGSPPCAFIGNPMLFRMARPGRNR